jgi:hypothetical protein
MPPLRLSDSDLDMIMHACRPISPERRDGFLQAVASELERCGEIGPGSVHRAIAMAQRAHFDPPDLSVGTAGRSSKYR